MRRSMCSQVSRSTLKSLMLIILELAVIVTDKNSILLNSKVQNVVGARMATTQGAMAALQKQ
jgi:hypothetical protein